MPVAQPAGNTGIGVIVEAGMQAERTLSNTIGDDGGEPYTFEGWQGGAGPVSGLLEGSGAAGPELYDKVAAAAHDLVRRVLHE